MKQTNELIFEIYNVTDQLVKNLTPVTELDIYESGTNNFHPNGLFSSSIFGRVGDKERDQRFSYIKTNIEVLHPLIYKNVVKLKKFYSDIIRGTSYAVYDEKLNDFLPSDPIDGETGYYFFLKHWDNIVFKRNDSRQRNARIDFIEKYRSIAKCKYVLVMPAGLRDLEFGDDGREIEVEINEHYRKLISISNSLNARTNINTSLTDSARLSVQNAFNAIYEFIIQMLGKGEFIVRKWARRRVTNATASVITAMVPSVEVLGNNEYPQWNNTIVGIAQMLKAILPVAIHKLSTFELYTESFPVGSSSAFLINPDTLRRENVELSNKTMDTWTTYKGQESIFEKFMDHDIRLKALKIEGRYIGLVWRGVRDGYKGFKLLYDISEADEYPWMSKDDIYPITWIEFMYLMGYKDWNKYPMTSARYPISGAGSVYPSFVFIKTTVNDEKRHEFDASGEVILQNKAIAYPEVPNGTVADTMSPHPSRLAGLGGDFDGDRMSALILYSDEAIAEINDYVHKALAYIRPEGGLLNSVYTDPIQRVLHNITGDYRD